MKFGLIGYPLSHSFSKVYFTSKFESLGVGDFIYELYPLETIEEFPALLRSDVFGWNVTIPVSLYTSDAADDLLCVDLGGRRILKKKKPKQQL